MKKAAITTPILLITVVCWLIPISSMASLPGPNHVWIVVDGRFYTGFVESNAYHSSASPVQTTVYFAGRSVCALNQPIEMVAGGFAAAALALGIGAGASVGGFRNRRNRSEKTDS